MFSNSNQPRLKQQKLQLRTETTTSNSGANTPSRSTLSSNNKHKKSLVWKFLEDKPDDKDSLTKICRLCKRTLCTSKNTTNARTHMKNKHPLQWKKAENEAKPASGEGVDSSSESELSDLNVLETSTADNDSEGTTVTVDAVENTENNATSKTSQFTANKLSTMRKNENTRYKQVKLKTIFKRQQKKNSYSKDSKKKIKLDRLLLEMIVTDFQPFSIVYDKGFTKFVGELDERYKMPCPNTLSTTLLTKYFNIAQNKLNQILSATKNVAFTYDTWTSIANNCYLTLTGHFIHENSIKKCTLSFIDTNGSHDSDHLANLIQNELEKIPYINVTGCTSDNAKNMISTATKLNFDHVGCFAHTVQLVIRDAFVDSGSPKLKEEIKKLNDKNFDIESILNQVNFKAVDVGADDESENIPKNNSVPEILVKVKRIAQLFNQSTKCATLLREELKSKGIKNKSLIQDVCTRWNSTYYMLNRFYELSNAIVVVLPKLNKANLLLFEEEMQAIPDILSALVPFLEITKQISAENIPTINLIVPLTTSLITELELNISPAMKTELGKSFAHFVISQTKRRLLIYENSSVARYAAILDPRFKELAFYMPENYESATRDLGEILKKRANLVQKDKDRTEDLQKEQSNSAPIKLGILKNLFLNSDKASPTKKQKTTAKGTPIVVPRINSSAATIVKFNTYLSESKISSESEDMNIILFWNEYPFKELSDFAKEILIIPGSSVSSERECSTAEYTLGKRRSKITSEKLKKIIFLNQNLQLVDLDL